MGYEDKAAAAAKPHRIVLDERARLSVTGVSDVLSFDEDRIVMHTVKGELTVVGGAAHRQAQPRHGGAVRRGQGERPQL